MADSVAARVTSGFSRIFAAVSRICVQFGMQLLRQNQESFTGLKHYRPFCFKKTLFGTNSVRGNAHKKPQPNLRLIIKSRASIYLLILSVAALGGPRRPAAETASTAPTVLQWQLHDTTDQMTGKTTREAISGGTFDDGLTLQTHASCNQIGAQFLFDAFRGRDPAPFTQTDDGIPMRVRIDDEEVRTVHVKADHLNEVSAAFYDPATTEKLIRGAYDPTDILARLKTETLMEQVRQNATGTLRQLAGAKSIRVELSLADGHAYVVDLNPQDDALKTIVQQCMAALHVGTGAVPAAPNQAGQRRHVAPTAAEVGCKPGLKMVVNSSTMMPVLSDYFKKQHPNLPEPPYRMSPGIVVEVASKEESASLSAKYKIPGDRCIVIYNDLHAGKVAGMIDVKALTVAAQN